MEKREIHCHGNFFPSNRFIVKFFSKALNLTEFLRKNHGSKIPKCPQLRVKRRAQNTHALHSGKIKNLTEKIFRQTNYLIISLAQCGKIR